MFADTDRGTHTLRSFDNGEHRVIFADRTWGSGRTEEQALANTRAQRRALAEYEQEVDLGEREDLTDDRGRYCGI